MIIYLYIRIIFRVLTDWISRAETLRLRLVAVYANDGGLVRHFPYLSGLQLASKTFPRFGPWLVSSVRFVSVFFIGSSAPTSAKMDGAKINTVDNCCGHPHGRE